MNLASLPLDNPASAAFSVKKLGLVEYQAALNQQRLIHAEVVGKARENTLLLLEHPSIYTAGKRTAIEERPTNGVPVIDVDRGGKITWHGPGQIVGYPIIRLAQPTELVGYVRELEGALIEVCSDFDIAASRVEGRSGVWVVRNGAPRKIAAIGIRVASGVSMHGFALNVNPDLSAFSKIIPCGISDAEVTSLALELGRSITTSEVLPVVEKYLTQRLVKVGA